MQQQPLRPLPQSITSTFARPRESPAAAATAAVSSLETPLVGKNNHRVDVPLVGSTGETSSMVAQQSCLVNAAAFHASLRSQDENRRRKRKPQICRICGHAKQAPAWKGCHAFNQGSSSHCQVPEQSRRVGYPIVGKSSHTPYNPCDCQRCADYLLSEGITLS